jgi:hypothetical protein
MDIAMTNYVYRRHTEEILSVEREKSDVETTVPSKMILWLCAWK